jgi:hypothetical protein
MMGIFDRAPQSLSDVKREPEAESTLRELERGRPTWEVPQGTRIDDLATRLRETVNWCASQMERDARIDCLRDRSVAPQALSNSRWGSVSDVAHLRRQFLSDRVAAKRWHAKGRLVIYYPDAEVTDGASEAASDAFFDLYDAPPWGTWVAYFEDPNASADSAYGAYLVAWVPEELVAQVEAGVEVNCVSAVVWLDQAEVRVRPILESMLEVMNAS